ncbi:hypothetical protein V6N12_071876 [Hibiscus sabdariffa]|uniref:Uncharacterized protein n=1 Tax=Hibiscus sabdariffa TaxID=183260 RepID=A0ABR2FLP7_9ROSI
MVWFWSAKEYCGENFLERKGRDLLYEAVKKSGWKWNRDIEMVEIQIARGTCSFHVEMGMEIQADGGDFFFFLGGGLKLKIQLTRQPSRRQTHVYRVHNFFATKQTNSSKPPTSFHQTFALFSSLSLSYLSSAPLIQLYLYVFSMVMI